MPSSFIKRSQRLKVLQKKHFGLEAKLSWEIEVLKFKYLKKYKKLYRKRSKLINCSKEGEKRIPFFWLKSLQANDFLKKEITKSDCEALKYLNNIKWRRKTKGYKLVFNFDKNPYFMNSDLAVEFVFEDEVTIEKVQGTIIKWHDQNLTQLELPIIEAPKVFEEKYYYIINQEKMVPEMVSSKRKHVKIEYFDSFFNLFDSVALPGEEGFMGRAVDGYYVHDEERIEQAVNRASRKHQIGKIVRDVIIPQSWFNEYYEDVDPQSDVGKCIEDLRVLQYKHNELEKEFVEQRAALEEKYHKKYEKLYTKRYALVNGRDEDKVVTFDNGYPGFWRDAMLANKLIVQEITRRDCRALKYLRNITWSKIPKGFKLDFFFGTNPYFKNSVLTKKYYMTDAAEPILRKVVGTKIEWHSSKKLTLKKLRKISRKKGKILKTVRCESFFNIFSRIEYTEEDDNLNNLENEYDIGSAFRDEIIPHAYSLIDPFLKHEDDEDNDQPMGEAVGGEDDEDHDHIYSSL